MPGPNKFMGRYSCLEILSAEKHTAELYHAYRGHDAVWNYMASGPFNSSAQFCRWVNEIIKTSDPLYYAIRNLESGKWEGIASFLRIKPASGSIEVGNISFSPSLQRSIAATEAMFLMMGWVFKTGYRLYEWSVMR